MVGDMENYKVLVNNEAESKEVQDLFFELGGDFYFGGKLHCNTHSRLVTINKDGLMANLEFGGFDYVEITLQQLRDLVVWKRNTTIQNKLKFIEKWLNGEKIQYILGNESEKTQSDESKWHNFTEGAMRYIKRSDIKFREAPKYVTINGIEFKSVERLLKHVKNNFDLEGGE